MTNKKLKMQLAADGEGWLCPALLAESGQREAESLLIQAMAEYTGEITASDADRIDRGIGGLDRRNKFIDLAAGFAVNHCGAGKTPAGLKL